MKNLAHNTYQCLFHQHTEKDGISYFSEALEDLCPQIRVLNQFSKLSLIVAHNTCDNKINSEYIHLQEKWILFHFFLLTFIMEESHYEKIWD